MKRWTGMAAVLVAAAPVLGGTVLLTSPLTTVPAGTPVLVDVAIDTALFAEFQIGAVVVGSNDAMGFAGFTYAAEWLSEFGGDVYPPDYSLTPYTGAQLRVGGNKLPGSVNFLDATIELGSFAIDTTGMTPGVYGIGVDFMQEFESQIVTGLGGEGDPTIDELYGAMTFTVTPEPATLAMVALGAFATRRLPRRGNRG